MTRLFSLLLLAAAAAPAQPVIQPIAFFPPELVQYLDLKPAQIEAISALNATQARFEFDKARRAAQVNEEIAYWTAQSPLDPGQLGMRYVELEAIRRETADQRKRTEEQVQTVLTAPQKSKIAALVEARKLMAIADMAECQGLLPAQNQPGGSPVISFANVFPISGAFYFPSLGCRSLVFKNVVP